MIRDRTVKKYGAVAPIGEPAWIGHYIDLRRAWLAGHRNAALHPTVYRMDAFRKLIVDGTWDLRLPLIVRGVRITEELLSTGGPVRVSAEGKDEKILMLTDPLTKGERVKELQRALAAQGYKLEADGVFGPGTKKAVIAFQNKKKLTADGVVGPATRKALGL